MLQKPPWRREQSRGGRTGIVCLSVKRCGKTAAGTALAMQRTVCPVPVSGAFFRGGCPSVEGMERFQTARCGRRVPRCSKTAGNCIDCRLSVEGSRTNARPNQWEQFGEKGRGKTRRKSNSRDVNNRINCAPGWPAPLLGSREGNLTPFFERSPRRFAPRSGCFPVPGGAGRPWWC